MKNESEYMEQHNHDVCYKAALEKSLDLSAIWQNTNVRVRVMSSTGRPKTISNFLLLFVRCPSYPDLDPACRLRPNPNDQCCLVPDCNPNYVTPSVQPGISGSNTPAPIDGQTPPRKSIYNIVHSIIVKLDHFTDLGLS